MFPIAKITTSGNATPKARPREGFANALARPNRTDETTRPASSATCANPVATPIINGAVNHTRTKARATIGTKIVAPTPKYAKNAGSQTTINAANDATSRRSEATIVLAVRLSGDLKHSCSPRALPCMHVSNRTVSAARIIGNTMNHVRFSSTVSQTPCKIGSRGCTCMAVQSLPPRKDEPRAPNVLVAKQNEPSVSAILPALRKHKSIALSYISPTVRTWFTAVLYCIHE